MAARLYRPLALMCVIMLALFLNPAKAQSQFFGEPIQWFEQGIAHQAWMASDQLAVLHQGSGSNRQGVKTALSALYPQGKVIDGNGLVTLLQIDPQATPAALAGLASNLAEQTGLGRVSPVFYTSSDRNPGSRLILTGEIIVRFTEDLGEDHVADLENQYGLERVKSFSYAPNTFLYRIEPVSASLSTANLLAQLNQVLFAYPNWLRIRPERSSRTTPDDTLFDRQWNLDNTGQDGGTEGQDANILSVWDQYRGSSNQVIAVVDNGVDIGHEDLSANVMAGLNWDFVDGDNDPTSTASHGTAVAGVAAGRGFNGLGICGAAPLAGLVGLRLLDAQTDANEAEALTWENQTVDIYNNSWGPTDDGKRLEGPGPLTLAALTASVTQGRDGRGSVYVWAGGNGQAAADNANYDGYANSRYTIAVAASDNSGRQSWYSEPGANLIVNAPSNGGSMAITTTYPTGLGPVDENYTGSFGGTSSAAPLVAGVVALMLEANPDLTWRDVIAVLIETAFQNDPTDTDWVTNGAGYLVNHLYGFGRVDAQAAVNLAPNWNSLGEELSLEGSASPDLAIPDNNPIGVSSTVSLTGNLTVEYVEVYFTAQDHTSWGDLEIVLSSPNGVSSTLAETHAGGTDHRYDQWRFGTARPFGESPAGPWTLTVKDGVPGNTGTFQKWSLVVYGHTPVQDTPQTSSSGGGGCFLQPGHESRASTRSGS